MTRSEYEISLSEFADPSRWPELVEFLASPFRSLTVVGSTSCDVVAMNSESSVAAFLASKYDKRQVLAVWDTNASSGQWLRGLLGKGQEVHAADCFGSLALVAERHRDAEVIIGIGDNTAINGAKALACILRSHPALVLLPSSLATDSFLTNRYRLLTDDEVSPSRIGRYPDCVLIAQPLIQSAPARVNDSGLGEYIAMYSALLDLSVCEPRRDLASAIAASEIILRNVKDRIPVNSGRVSMIFGLLALKALVMWAHDDCRWGAGSEHKIAHALCAVTRSRVLHGEACAFGTWLICRFLALHGGLPVDLNCLRSVMAQTGLPVTPSRFGLSHEDVNRVLRVARDFRRERPGLIDSLGLTDLSDMWPPGVIK